MACEKKGVHDLPSVVCTAPAGYPENEQNSKNNLSILRVFGAITIVAIVMAGVVGTTYLVSHSSSSGGSMLDESKEHQNSEGNRKEFLVHFYFEGKIHTETIIKDEDQNLVTIVDENIGFVVTQDYDQGIAMIKNTTSSDCFFTHLGYIQTSDMKTLTPIIVQEVANVTSPVSSNDERTVTLVRSDIIPPEYIQVSNRPAIAKQCIDSTSYWLKGTPSSRVRRRGPIPSAPVTMPPPDLPDWLNEFLPLYIRC